jgi:hypothetical protein
MKISRILLLTILCAASAACGLRAADADDAPPELRGVLMLGKTQRFALSTPGGAQTGWVSVGESFNDWVLVEFRQKDDVVVLRKGERTVEVSLAASTVQAGDNKATIEDAEEVMQKMNFEKMFAKIMEQQKANALKMSKQMVAQMQGQAGQPEIDPEEFAAFQSRILDVVWTAMNPEQMQADMTAIYSEVFTKAELRGMADFYGTPAGIAMSEKSPEVQQRMSQLMMPRMATVMPQIQQLAREFGEQQKQKAAQRRAAAQAEAAPGQQAATPAPANP